MPKYCHNMGLFVTYLDCLECETQECKQGNSREEVIQKQRVLHVGDTIYYETFYSRQEYVYCGIYQNRRLLYGGKCCCDIKDKRMMAVSDHFFQNNFIRKIIIHRTNKKDYARKKRREYIYEIHENL